MIIVDISSGNGVQNGDGEGSNHVQTSEDNSKSENKGYYGRLLASRKF